MAATAQAEVRGLGHEPVFRRFVAVSAVLHLGLVGFAWFSPRFPRKLDPRTIVVVEAAIPAPPKQAAVPKPPPDTKPPDPVPEPPEAKPRQEVEEAIVIPAVPREKPRNRPKPPPEKKPEPKPEKKPDPPQQAEQEQSAEDLIAAMREKVGEDVTPAPSGGPGVVDPELARYVQERQQCFYANWIGLQRYRRRLDLQVEFEVRVTAEGGVLSVDKTRGSGDSFLDDSAERAIRKCSPGDKFPPPPRGRNLLRFTFTPAEVI